MVDPYNKPDKAGTKQQLRSRLAHLNDALRHVEEEKTSILVDILSVQARLDTLTEEGS